MPACGRRSGTGPGCRWRSDAARWVNPGAGQGIGRKTGVPFSVPETVPQCVSTQRAVIGGTVKVNAKGARGRGLGMRRGGGVRELGCGAVVPVGVERYAGGDRWCRCGSVVPVGFRDARVGLVVRVRCGRPCGVDRCADGVGWCRSGVVVSVASRGARVGNGGVGAVLSSRWGPEVRGLGLVVLVRLGRRVGVEGCAGGVRWCGFGAVASIASRGARMGFFGARRSYPRMGCRNGGAVGCWSGLGGRFRRACGRGVGVLRLWG